MILLLQKVLFINSWRAFVTIKDVWKYCRRYDNAQMAIFTKYVILSLPEEYEFLHPNGTPRQQKPYWITVVSIILQSHTRALRQRHHWKLKDAYMKTWTVLTINHGRMKINLQILTYTIPIFPVSKPN